MKKKIVVTLITLVSLNSLANLITPNRERSQRTRASDALGLAWTLQNAVGLQYTSSDYKQTLQRSSSKWEGDQKSTSVYGQIATEALSVDLDILSTKKTDGETSSERKYENSNSGKEIRAAYRANKHFALVGSAFDNKNKNQNEVTSEESEKRVGLSYVTTDKKIYAGLTLNTYKRESLNSKPSKTYVHNTKTLAIGYDGFEGINGHTLESQYSWGGEKETFGEYNSLTLAWLYTINDFQYQAGIQTYKYVKENQKDKTNRFSLSLEYLLTDTLYISPSYVNKRSREIGYNDSDTKTKVRRLAIGHRQKNFELSAYISKDEIKKDEVSSTDFSSTGFDFAYLF